MLQSQNNALARSSLLRNGTEFTRTKGSSAPTVAAPYIPDGQRSSGSRSSARGPSPFAAGCSSTSVPGPIAPPASKGTCDARSRKATFQYRAGRARRLLRHVLRESARSGLRHDWLVRGRPKRLHGKVRCKVAAGPREHKSRHHRG